MILRSRSHCRSVLSLALSNSRPQRGSLSTPRSLSSTTSTSSPLQDGQYYDIVVSGGGSVSVSFLLSLVKNLCGSTSPSKDDLPIKILIAESRSRDNIAALRNVFTTNTPDLRVYALNAASMKFLDQSCGNVLSRNEVKSRSRPYKGMSICDSQGSGNLMFSSAEIGKSELGSIVEDVALQASLYNSLELVSGGSNYNSEKKSDDSNDGGCVDVAFGSSVVDIKKLSNSNSNIKVSIKDNSSGMTSHVYTKLLVGADGANSFVRKAMDIPTKSFNYGEEGIVVSVELENKASYSSNSNSNDSNVNFDWNSIAYQRYLKTGPLAILPSFKNYASLVWTLPSSDAKAMLSLSDQDFVNKLNAALQSPAANISYPQVDRSIKNPLNLVKNEFIALAQTIENGMIHLANQQLHPDVRGKSQMPIITKVTSKRASFPLQCQHVTKYFSAPGVVLLGDAAHSIHPHAGQGLNLGFADARDLANILASCLKSGGDIGSAATLNAYHDARFSVNTAALSTVHALHEIFVLRNGNSKYSNNNSIDGNDNSNNSSLRNKFLWLRSVGMLAVNSSSAMKKLLAKGAMGDF